VLGMLALLVVGVVTADLVTSSSVRSFLYGRLDEQIDASQNQAYGYIYNAYLRDVESDDTGATTAPQQWLAQLALPSAETGPCGPGSPTTGTQRALGRSAAAAAGATPSGVPRLNGGALSARLSPDAYVEVIDGNGQVLFRDPSGPCDKPDPAPVLPASLPVQSAPAPLRFGENHGPYAPDRPSFEVGAQGSSGVHYRGEAVAVPGGTLVTAISLDPTQQTLASLTHVELFVSIAVVMALVVLALWIVRIGLRPLEDMTTTAGAIAAGDLTQRIRSVDEQSEVGRLGRALNGMLIQIEAAFEERTASEARLRRFVADASHELRTPLTSIRGYAELLRKGAFDTEVARQRAAERIEGEAARMSLLVSDLLLLARLDQGRPLEREVVDLRRVAAEAVDDFAVLDDRRSVVFEAGDSVVVEGDGARLRQIVDNLLHNALTHTPPGTEVRVAVARRGPSALLSVSDNGPGLDAEQAARVFDRFYRGSEARTGEGTGLGLSIVAALAGAQGGRAWVDAAPGGGAVFSVEIPALLAAGEAGAEPSVPARFGDPPPAGPTAPSAPVDGASGRDERVESPLRR